MTRTPREQADRHAEEADRLVALVRGLHRRPSRRPADDEPRDARFAPWMPTAQTAAVADGRAVWADDGALRVLARALGAPAFGTAALLEGLADGDADPRGAHAPVLAEMVRAGIWAPVDDAALVRIAEQDGRAPSSAAAVVASPALWMAPAQAQALLGAVLPHVARNNPQQVAWWVRLCARAVAYAHSSPLPAASVSGTLLAAAVHLVQAAPADVPDLLAAVRARLSDKAPDPDVVADPLATFAALTMRLPGTVAPDP
jgi:hypothetical protein